MEDYEDSARARDYAMLLLSRRAYTEKGLFDKISRRYSEEHAAAAVARMIDLGLLDDEDYARRFAENRVKQKGLSPGRTALELKRKGIDGDIIENVVAELDGAPEPYIAAVIKRKYMDYLEDEKGRRKAVNALLRLGYRYGDIAAVLRNLGEDEEYYDDWEQDDG